MIYYRQSRNFHSAWFFVRAVILPLFGKSNRGSSCSRWLRSRCFSNTCHGIVGNSYYSSSNVHDFTDETFTKLFFSFLSFFFFNKASVLRFESLSHFSVFFVFFFDSRFLDWKKRSYLVGCRKVYGYKIWVTKYRS